MSILTALPRFQRLVEDRMTDACMVTRGGTPVLNETTQQYDDANVQTVYSGPCEVQSSGNMSASRDIGNALRLVNRLTVKVPITATGFVSGDMVTITVAGDQQLVGAVYALRSIADKSHATCRRLEVEEP